MSQIPLDKCPIWAYNPSMLFMNRDPSDVYQPWKEWQVQAYIVQELRRKGYTVHGDGNGLSLTPKGMMQKTVCGAMKGWPDLAILLPEGRTLWIELKIDNGGKSGRKTKGRLSKEQKDMEKVMKELGHRYEVVWADCPQNGLMGVMECLGEYGGGGEGME